MKLTHQRIEIFREVARTGDHPDAETIFKRVRKRIPTVSLDTVCRTLWMLNDVGLISTLGSQRGRVRFDGNASPHHHFICTKCGKAGDFYSKEFDDLEVVPGVRIPLPPPACLFSLLCVILWMVAHLPVRQGEEGLRCALGMSIMRSAGFALGLGTPNERAAWERPRYHSSK